MHMLTIIRRPKYLNSNIMKWIHFTIYFILIFGFKRCGTNVTNLIRRWYAKEAKESKDAKIVTPSESDKYELKAVRVSILGAESQTGQSLSLLLKQNPLISHLFTCDRGTTIGLAADLRHIDTRSDITGFVEKDLNKAIRNADIIVLLGLDSVVSTSTIRERLKTEGTRVLKLAAACATYAPKAMVCVCVNPVSVTLPLVSNLYRRTHWYHPGRVIGSVALLQIRMNTLLARYQGLDPSSVHVPLIGGPDQETIVPLFSRALPVPVSITEARMLTNRFRNLDDDADPTERPKNTRYDNCPNSQAYALNRMVTTMALGLLNDDSAICTSYVRSNYTADCKHIVSTVKFGKNGVAHNYGVPRLTKFELRLFEQSCLELKKRESIATEYMSIMENTAAPKTVEDGDITNRIYLKTPSTGVTEAAEEILLRSIPKGKI